MSEYVKYPTKKSCDKCAKLYDEELEECPKCGCKMFWCVYILQSDLWEDSLAEDHNFTFNLKFP